ncbi:PREDICTED: myelin and lymphocyte protein [Tinamus guttatus]|uniref:myelin and lymphocyte protein n=1 Tax=Tinamus guttatus TaxID=94827 RepID=UPI00052EDF01|nr:PREDICTED: myelin and lymphocyte protein [Tinamus guttatus]
MALLLRVLGGRALQKAAGPGSPWAAPLAPAPRAAGSSAAEEPPARRSAAPARWQTPSPAGGREEGRERGREERRAAASDTSLPRGLAVLTTFPDVLFIPEIIFGGLVWILVASSKVVLTVAQGWIMFVSVLCFVMSIALLCLYLCGAHGGSRFWVALDAFCHGMAALFYLSAAVLEAYVTYLLRSSSNTQLIYQENIAAVVFAFLATLMYVIHQVYSLLRWKSS